jgi:hypothetical protein
MKIDTDKLLTNQQLLEALFPAENRPSVRTLSRWQKRRIVPYYKIGNRVYFDLSAVREKLNKKNLVRAI